MNLKYLKKLQPILNKVGKKHNITIDEGSFIVGEFFISFKNAITDVRVPKVKLPLFGTFKPKVSYINRSLRASIKFHKLGGTTYEYLVSRIKRIWPVRNRIIKEYLGEVTWFDWRDEEVKLRFEKLKNNEQEEKRKSKEKIYGSLDNPKESPKFFGEIQKGLHKKDRKQRKP